MKLTRTAGIAIIVFLLSSACGDDADISTSIEGKWRGTLAELQVKPFGLPVPISEDDASFNTEIEFAEDGNIIVWDNSLPREGTYQMTGEKLTIDIDYVVEEFELSGTYDIETLTETTLVFQRKKNGETIVDPNGAPTVKGQIKLTLHFERI